MKNSITVKYYLEVGVSTDGKAFPFKKMRISKKQFNDQMNYLKDMLLHNHDFDEFLFLEKIDTYDYKEHTVTTYTFGYTEEHYDDIEVDENHVLLSDDSVFFVERTTLTIDKCKAGYFFLNNN